MMIHGKRTIVISTRACSQYTFYSNRKTIVYGKLLKTQSPEKVMLLAPETTSVVSETTLTFMWWW